MKKKLHYLTSLLPAIVLLLSGQAAFAQNRIGGTVTDERGNPLVGVTVVVEGTSTGTTTDTDGRYSIQATEGSVLEFSSLGAATRRETVGAGVSTLNVVLSEDVTGIDEVIVVGYGTQKRVNLTGAVATISSEQIEQRPIVSVSSALQGLAPGVTVTTQSGAPGGDGGTIRIRGINSFGGSSTSPLVLIDGIEGTMDSIDPTQIESISILKDAASASIYGSRAANGVILVTTKRGGADRFSLTYKGHVGWQSPTMLPEAVNAVEFNELMNVIAANDGTTPYLSEEELELYRKNMGKDPDLFPNTDWQKAVLVGSGFSHNHNLTMTMSTDRVRMMTSLGYVDQKGIIANSDFQRYSFRNNSDVKLRKNLTMKLDIDMSYGDRLASPYQSTIFNYMNTRPADIPNVFTTGLYNGLGLNGSNPVAMMYHGGQSRTNTLRLTGAISLGWQPVKWLTLEGKLAPRYVQTNSHRFVAPVETYTDYLGTTKLTNRQYHELTESASRAFYGNYNFLATFDKDFGGHNLKVILGTERNTYDYNYLMAYRQGFNYPTYDQITAGEAPDMDNNGYRYQWAIQSFFGRINYNFKERYLLEANLRIDGSSRFSKANRWGYFPSISGAWRISEEPFMKEAKHILSNLKLRASYGTLGNQNLAGSDAASYYPTSQNLSVGSFTMNDIIYSIATLNTLANPDITWESTTVTDVGIDIALFGKLNITADWYNKITNDILMTLDISPAIGLSAPYQNAGKVRNTGWELSVGYTDRWGDFTFGINANIADVNNKILDMKGLTATSGVLRNQEGSSIASIYALRSMGYIQTQEEADWINANCPQYNTVHPGDLRYYDANHDNEITDDDREIIGSTIPRYTYSASINFGWKGLKLSALFQGVGKVDGYLNYYYVMPNVQNGTFRKAHLDYWTPENRNAQTPRLTNDTNNWKDSSFWMRSASYLRLKNLQLGYEFPQRWMSKASIKSLYVYVNAQNLFTVTNFWRGYDPEVAYGGDSSGNFDAVAIGGASAANNYPQVKIYTVGLELKF